jgi:2-hydroxychromene-2-carboxylate isomerase
MSRSLLVPVHFDFASSLCCVAHRVMQRLAAPIAELGVTLRWTPIDLTRLGPWRRGAVVPELRLRNARRVARELDVPVAPQRVWPDSRRAAAAAILSEGTPREESWRERVFTALYDEGRSVERARDVRALARELGWDPDPRALEGALEELETRTLLAADAMVTGVPTFMLGRWPFGGIQSDETMLRILERFASRARRGELA